MQRDVGWQSVTGESRFIEGAPEPPLTGTRLGLGPQLGEGWNGPWLGFNYTRSMAYLGGIYGAPRSLRPGLSRPLPRSEAPILYPARAVDMISGSIPGPSNPMASPTPISTESVTTCPTCGAKIKRRGMSLCAYCAAPLTAETSETAAAGQEDPQLARIAKVVAHETYGEQVETAPPEGPQWQVAGDRRRRGLTGLGLGLVSALCGASLLAWPPLLLGISWLAWLGLALALWGLAGFVGGGQARARITAQPLLARAALITDRRSETSLEEGGTSYYFTLKFEDGNTSEARFPGRGSSEEVYATGACGLAFTRGDELLEFRRFRV